MSSFKKKLITVGIFLSLASASIAVSPRTEKTTNKTFDVSVNVGQLLLGLLPLRLGFAVNDKVGIGIIGGGRFYSLGQSNIWGLYAGADAKFYLTAKPYEDGWFVKPGITLGYTKFGSRGGMNFAGFVVGGYNWIWDSGFSMDLGLGFQYLYVNNKITDEYSFGLSGLVPSIDFSVGWAF